jgi:F-type H+-transporting ATPase subunit a
MMSRQKYINNLKKEHWPWADAFTKTTRNTWRGRTHNFMVHCIVVLKDYQNITTKIAWFIVSAWTLFFFFLGNYSVYMLLVLTLIIMAFLSLTMASLIYALVFLMITYINAAIIFFVIGLDFLALSLLFIYVGAVAILFIFVIMTLSPDRSIHYYGFSFFDKFCLFFYSMFLFAVSLLFTCTELPIQAFYRWSVYNYKKPYLHIIESTNDNITHIGLLLYGVHTFLFYLVVLILFLGFFAPIVLTIDENAKDREPDSKTFEIDINTKNNEQTTKINTPIFIMLPLYNNIYLNSPLEMFEANVTGWLGLEISDGALSAIISFILSYVSSVISSYEVIIEEDEFDLINDEFNDTLDEVIADNIGDDDDDELVGIIQFVFQTILFSNFINLMPLGDTTSSNLVFTLSMAATCFIALNLNGIFIHSYSMINLFLPHGVPAFLKPMLFVIEIISYFARLFSLGIRLFANMMAGHILIAILFTFFSIMLSNIGVGTIAAAILFALITAIIVLEIIISYLQAYVFGLLVTLYYGDIINLAGHDT